jgi:hypothetical protein
MNEEVRNNVFFDSAKAFRQALTHFFTDLIPAMKDALLSRITDNFQTFNTVFSG